MQVFFFLKCTGHKHSGFFQLEIAVEGLLTIMPSGIASHPYLL